MPSLDIFNNDAFSLQSLTASIIEQPYVPGRIGQLGIFQSQGISTTGISVEVKNNQLSLVPAKQRGAPPTPQERAKRSLIPFNAIHLPKRDYITADEVINLRAFGSESDTEVVQTLVNQRLAAMRVDLDATIEFQRIGAIKGKILDADGETVLVDIYDRFGIKQETVAFKFSNADTKVRNLVTQAKRKSEKALGNLFARGYRAMCGDAWFDKFIDHPDVRAAYERYQNGEMLRNDPRGGFEFAGVQFENYSGAVGDTHFIAEDEAYLFPETGGDMFITRFAPGDYIEAAGTLGLPYYAKQEVAGMGKGVDLEAQSNPISLCTRPGGVIKLTMS